MQLQSVGINPRKTFFHLAGLTESGEVESSASPNKACFLPGLLAYKLAYCAPDEIACSAVNAAMGNAGHRPLQRRTLATTALFPRMV